MHVSDEAQKRFTVAAGIEAGKPAARAAHRPISPIPGRYGPGGLFWRAHRELDGKLAAGWLDIWNEPHLNAHSANDVNPAR